MTIPTIPFGSTGHLSTRCIFGAAALARAAQEQADRTLEVLLRYGMTRTATIRRPARRSHAGRCSRCSPPPGT